MTSYLFRIAFAFTPFVGVLFMNRSAAHENMASIHEEFKTYRRAFWPIDQTLVDDAEQWEEREIDKQQAFLSLPIYKQLLWPPSVDHDFPSETR